MKEIGIKAKAIIAAIVFTSTAAVIAQAWNLYSLEEDLRIMKEARAEILTESPAEVVQLHKLDGTPIETAALPTVRKFRQVTAEITQEVILDESPAPKVETFEAHGEIPLEDKYQEWIESECERLEVDPGYIYALIESESSFRIGIVIEDGGGHSAGLCQINSVNWPDMEKHGLDPLNEFDNITYCVTMVKSLFDRYPTADHVTTCYKAGEGGAKRLGYHLAVCETINERAEYFNNILKGGSDLDNDRKEND